MKTRRHLAARILTAMALAACAFGAHAIELRGFRGVSWGDEAGRLGAATLVLSDGDVSCYQRDNENLIFGDSDLKAVRYCFHQDRLFSVTLDAAVSAKALRAELERTYGRPDARRGTVASWTGKSSGARLVAQGEAAQLTLYSSQVEPALARRVAEPLGTAAAAGY